MIRAILTKHPSGLPRATSQDGPAWAAEELRRFWRQLGQELETSESHWAVFAPYKSPFCVPFLQYTLWPALGRDELLTRYRELDHDMSRIRPADFTWNAEQGRFRFRDASIMNPKLVEVPVAQPIDLSKVAEVTSPAAWSFDTPIAYVNGERLWQVGRTALGDLVVILQQTTVTQEAFRVTVVNAATGEVAASQPFQPFRLQRLDYREGSFYLGWNDPVGQRLCGVIEPETGTVRTLSEPPASLADSWHPFLPASSWSWDTTKSLLEVEGREFLHLVPGETTMYVRLRAKDQQFFWALDRSQQRTRWQVRAGSGQPMEQDGLAIIPTTYQDRKPRWVGVEVETGKPAWAVTLPNPSYDCVGLHGGRLVFHTEGHFLVIDARSGAALHRIELEQPVVQNSAAPLNERVQFSSAGIIAVSKRKEGPGYTLRLYAWP